MTWTIEIGPVLGTVVSWAVLAFAIDRWWAYSTLRNRKP